MTPTYYKAVYIKRKHGAAFDAAGNEINEEERGLTGKCEATGEGHAWLRYPEWSVAVKEGGKEYIICLNCGEHGHL